MTGQPESWGKYPDPHYDEDDDCECPDHVLLRRERDAETNRWSGVLR